MFKRGIFVAGSAALFISSSLFGNKNSNDNLVFVGNNLNVSGTNQKEEEKKKSLFKSLIRTESNSNLHPEAVRDNFEDRRNKRSSTTRRGKRWTRQEREKWSEKVGSSDLQLDSWMSNLPPDLRREPLFNLTIPGSHDSGSFALDIGSGIAPDKPDLRDKWWIKWFPFLSFRIVKRWTVTQSLTVTDQLRAGVRYFDLRAAPKIRSTSSKDDRSSIKTSQEQEELFFVHGLYGPPILDLCREMDEFLTRHPDEVVILHVQHFLDTSHDQQLQLLDGIQKVFGSKLAPYHQNHQSKSMEWPPSLSSMSRNRHQVILFYPSSSCQSLHQHSRHGCPVVDVVWPPDLLPNPWANTTSEEYLRSFLAVNVSKRRPDRFYVTQGVLTPDDSFIKRHLFSSLKHRLADRCNESLVEFLSGEELVQKWGPKGPNIVMTDFVEWNAALIPRLVISLNYSQHSHSPSSSNDASSDDSSESSEEKE